MAEEGMATAKEIAHESMLKAQQAAKDGLMKTAKRLAKEGMAKAYKYANETVHDIYEHPGKYAKKAAMAGARITANVALHTLMPAMPVILSQDEQESATCLAAEHGVDEDSLAEMDLDEDSLAEMNLDEDSLAETALDEDN